MTRRMDTSVVGEDGEGEAAGLLAGRGWTVRNLNDVVQNHPLYDLEASKDGRTINVSVKVGRSANRQIRLGSYQMLSRLADEAFMFIFLPVQKGREIDLAAGSYELWIVPGHARHTALTAHLSYYRGDEAAASAHSVMVKDKADTPGGRSTSGAAFQHLRDNFKDAWSGLPA